MRDVVVVDTMGGLGDLLLALPVIEALGRSHPEARLTVVTTAPWHVLLERDDRIHQIVPVRGRDGDAVRSAATPVLQRIRPDLAVTTNRQHGLPALLEATASWAITDLWRRPPADEPVDLRMLRLLAEDGAIDRSLRRLPPRLVLDDAERAEGHRLLTSFAADRAALLFPDSGMAVKRWPLARWAEVAAQLRADGTTPIVVSEAAAQRDALEAVGAAVAPPLDLRALVALAAAVATRGGTGIGGDTGPVRLASAAGLPVVGLFGPTVATRYGYRDAAIDLQGLPECTVRKPTAITDQECWWTARCPLTRDHSAACMADITSPAVLAAARALTGD